MAPAPGLGHVFPEGLERGPVLGLRVGREIGFLRLLPDGRPHSPRTDHDHVDPEEHQLAPQAIREALEAELRGVIRADEGTGYLAAYRADVDNPSRRAFAGAILTEEVHEGLRHDQGTDQVHFDLLALKLNEVKNKAGIDWGPARARRHWDGPGRPPGIEEFAGWSGNPSDGAGRRQHAAFHAD